MAVINSSSTQHNEAEQRSRDDNRTRRAQEEEMNVALLRKGGVYEIDSASGNTYEVDILNEICTCPDHQNPETPFPCKHFQRVQLELDAGRIPRPDGRLPESRGMKHSLGGSSSECLASTLRMRIREREDRIATLEAEIQALQFVCDVAEEVGEGEEFDLKQLLADEYGPASQL
jgi:hypothetical protein